MKTSQTIKQAIENTRLETAREIFKDLEEISSNESYREIKKKWLGEKI